MRIRRRGKRRDEERYTHIVREGEREIPSEHTHRHKWKVNVGSDLFILFYRFLLHI